MASKKSIVRAEIPVRVKGNISCVHHRGTEVTLCCRQCSELACIRCIASVHDRHVLDCLADVIVIKKGNIQSFIDRTEQDDIIDLNTEIESIAQKMEDNERKFQMHQNELEKQGNRMKNEIDIIVKKSISISIEAKRENEKRLKKYKNDMEVRIRQLTILVQKCRETIESEGDVEIFDTEKKLDSLPHVELNLCKLTFTPNTQPQGYIDLAMGKLTTVGFQSMYAPNSEDNEDNSSMETLAHLEEVFQGRAPYNVSAICANKVQGAWICSNEVSSVHQLNAGIRICGTGCFKVCISDISVSPVTGNVWASSEDNAIIELLSQNTPIKRFTTTSTPRCLCVTRDSNIVIGMARKLVCCDVHGNVLLNKTVSTPTKVSACPVTGNIAVVELDFREHEGEGRPHILVLDKAFQKRYRHYKDSVDQGTTPDSSTSVAIHPSDVTFDSAGNLLVGDYGNNSIFLFDTTGKVIKSIYSDPWHVVAISANNKDSVWAVLRYRDYLNYKIKVLKPMY